MICIGKILITKTRLEQMVDTQFPGGLSSPDIVEAANEYERCLYKK